MRCARTALILVPALVVACMGNPDRHTLAKLRDVEPDVTEVRVENGLEQAMIGYRKFLEEAPKSSLTPEAMRRLADLELEKEFGILGHPESAALPEPDPAAGTRRGARDSQSRSPVASIADHSESEQEFERRASGKSEILPSKEIDLTLPPSAQLTFNPGDMPVCPDSSVGPPPTNVSVPVEDIVARCPDSVLGNGTAKLVLAQNNLDPNAALDGLIVVFNGGLQGGRPLVKVYAYSYDTQVAIYTESVLDKGNLTFNVPQLTSDSSVSQLNLAIPSKNITLNNWGPGAETVVLPKGKKSDYVKAQCKTGSWDWSADFTFGTRDTNNDPTSPDTFSSDSGEVDCVGVSGKAKISKVSVSGPSKVLKGNKATYKVEIKNSGGAKAKGVRLKVTGKGVSFNTSVGKIGAKKTKTVKVKAKFTKRGKVKAKFKVTSNNAGGKTAKKTIKVK
jgi:hypothetical protein